MNKLVIDPKLQALMDQDFVYDSDENIGLVEKAGGAFTHDHLLQDFDISRNKSGGASGASSPFTEVHGHVTGSTAASSTHMDSRAPGSAAHVAGTSADAAEDSADRGGIHRATDILGRGTDAARLGPDPDERYLSNESSFHYTSQFQARIHADKFDFYQGPKEHFRGAVDKSLSLTRYERDNTDSMQPKSNQGRNESGRADGHYSDNPSVAHGDTRYSNENHSSNVLESKHDRGDDDENYGSEDYDSAASDVSGEYETQLQDLLQRVTKFKSEFHQLITKLDEASLESARARVHYLNDISIRENMFMSTTTNLLLDTVARLLPRKNASSISNIHVSNDKDSQSSKEAAGLLRSMQSDNNTHHQTKKPDQQNTALLNTLYNASLENDPCSKLPNFGVILIKSPTNVEQLWNEYTKLPSDSNMKALLKLMLQQQSKDTIKKSDIALMKQRQTTIQDLERKYGSSWRNNDKNFSRQINRRKKIWGCIEQGLKDGLPLRVCFRILDKYVEDRNKGLSWYYNGVPFKLIDLASTYGDE